MSKMKTALACVALGTAAISGTAGAQQAAASFFVSSTNLGSGAWFGGLQGADWLCQTLATAAGSGGKTWRAYLSTSATASTPAVNARDRIGKGPWQNVKGVVIAKDLTELHGTNNITKQTALTEKGTVVNGSRRHSQYPRHSYRFAAGRDGICRQRRQDLRQLDQEWRRQRHCRA